MARLSLVILAIIASSTSLAKHPSALGCNHRPAAPEHHPHFPAGTFLGYGLDYTTITPNDVNSVIGNLKEGARVIRIDTSSTMRASVDSVHYEVPNNCFITGDTSADTIETAYHKDGTIAAMAFEGRPSLAEKYLAISSNADADYAIGKAFHPGSQYSLFDYQSITYAAGLTNWNRHINEAALVGPVRHLGPWDPTNSTAVDLYKSFFAHFGSHVITSVRYGARYQMTVWASSSDQCVDSEFEADVAFAYKGVSSNGRFDASIRNSCQYSKFSNRKSQQISVQGGDPRLADYLSSAYSNVSNHENFLDWVQTSYENPDLISVSVDSMWDVFSSAQSDVLYYAAPNLKRAFHWIVQNPAPHWTPVALSLNTDWARFRLLTPGAYIVEDPQHPYTDIHGASLTKNQVQIGHEHSHMFTEHPIVKFYVVNDGSPFDFTLSHGSGGQASASVFVNNVPMINNQVTDNYWNEVAYWSVPANPHIHLDTVAGTAAARHSTEKCGGGPADNAERDLMNCRSHGSCDRPCGRSCESARKKHRSTALRPNMEGGGGLRAHN
ncbi:hypothetical protein DL93DRAFT_2074954 [Clavulina sp. PMI_390]|nr:hypothetical protein DL93DRAFT_2074954 [Clavulina sp. PMI_390]